MNDTLKATYRSEELELAKAIGAQDGPIKERVLQLFKQLPDPLLATIEVAELLGIANGEEVQGALLALHIEGTIERSTTTTRPLDPAGVTLYRLAGVPFTRLKIVAMESRVSPNKTRLQFTCDGRLIRPLARVDRLDALAGKGNQRDEINSHVKKIAAGILAGTQVPNPILLTLLSDQIVTPEDEGAPESFVRITPLGEFTKVASSNETGTIVQEFRPVQIDFPYRRAAFDEEKSALLVDGQQRTAALSLVDVDIVPALYLSVNAEIASAEEAKAIFIVANSTAKIETQFSRALLATMEQSPGYLTTERPRALAAKTLAIEDTESPFYELVQYPGVKSNRKPQPPVAYNSLFQVLSIFAESGLPLPEKNPEQKLARMVSRGFNLIKKTWPSAWGVKPNESRLMHGVGLRSMATLIASKLESLYTNYGGDLDHNEMWAEIEASLRRLQPQLIWRVADTSNALKSAVKMYQDEISSRQNTTQDISALTKAIKRLSLDLDTEAAKALKGRRSS